MTTGPSTYNLDRLMKTVRREKERLETQEGGLPDNWAKIMREEIKRIYPEVTDEQLKDAGL